MPNSPAWRSRDKFRRFSTAWSGYSPVQADTSSYLSISGVSILAGPPGSRLHIRRADPITADHIFVPSYPAD